MSEEKKERKMDTVSLDFTPDPRPVTKGMREIIDDVHHILAATQEFQNTLLSLIETIMHIDPSQMVDMESFSKEAIGDFIHLTKMINKNKYLFTSAGVVFGTKEHLEKLKQIAEAKIKKEVGH